MTLKFVEVYLHNLHDLQVNTQFHFTFTFTIHGIKVGKTLDIKYIGTYYR
jgi:hypothetical protein